MKKKKKTRIVCTIFGFQDRFYLRIHLSCLVLLPFRRGHMVFSIFHSVVRARERQKERGKGKDIRKRKTDIYADIYGGWQGILVNVERRGETGEEKLPRERLISLSEKFRRAGHLSTYAPCSISSSSPIPSLPRQILQRPFFFFFFSRERVYLTVQIGRKEDEEKQGERRKRVFPRENSI